MIYLTDAILKTVNQRSQKIAVYWPQGFAKTYTCQVNYCGNASCPKIRSKNYFDHHSASQQIIVIVTAQIDTVECILCIIIMIIIIMNDNDI